MADEVITDLRAEISVRQTKKVNFMSKKIEINKLRLDECTLIQERAKTMNSDDPNRAFDLLMEIVRLGVPAASDFTDEDFQKFPMDDLNKLSDEVLKYAGMDPNKK